jgi:hypothetical protein
LHFIVSDSCGCLHFIKVTVVVVCTLLLVTVVAVGT